MITIWHNNRCSKSRDSLNLLSEKNESIELFEYFKNPPTVVQIIEVLQKLNIPAIELVRKNEVIFKTTFKDKDLTEEDSI